MMRQPATHPRVALPAKTTLALAAALLCHGYVAAQTLKDVVISGSRTEQRSFDAPGAITGVAEGRSRWTPIWSPQRWRAASAA